MGFVSIPKAVLTELQKVTMIRKTAKENIMKLYSDIKFFYRGFSFVNTNMILAGGLLMLSLLKVIYKKFLHLIRDIIDPDINYNSIEDMIE